MRSHCGAWGDGRGSSLISPEIGILGPVRPDIKFVMYNNFSGLNLIYTKKLINVPFPKLEQILQCLILIS